MSQVGAWPSRNYRPEGWICDVAAEGQLCQNGDSCGTLHAPVFNEKQCYLDIHELF
jgi:hypothetical protein